MSGLKRIVVLLQENRVVVLTVVLFTVIGALVYTHTSPPPITIPKPPTSLTIGDDRAEPVPYPISHRSWGHDPFVSPFIEERTEFLRKMEEERRRREEEEARKRREEQMRRKKAEEERKRREEEERKRRMAEKIERQKKRLAAIARKIKISGVMLLPDGAVQVFLNGRACVPGSSVWQDGERFRVVKVTEEVVVLEDRLGQRHQLEIGK